MNSLGFRSVFALAAVTALAACSASTSGTVFTTDGGTDSGVTGDASGPCAFGLVKCDGVCVSLAKDPDNCGMCGKACPTGQSCSTGVCKGAACSEGQTDCGGKCVSTQSDPANCGMCGKFCPTGQVCSAGACSVTCSSPQVKCTSSGGSDYCTNLATDRLNCGSCGNTCSSTETCVSGTCTVTCSSGTTNCSGVCRDLQTDATNCGFCGNACPTGLSCVAGSCTLVCSGGLTRCGTSCVSTATDPSNCGSCGNVCPTRANSTPSCTSSACRFTCNAGFGDCNAVATDGCEVNLMTSSSNCGMCGRTCSSGQTCNSGTCSTVTSTSILVFSDATTLAGEAATALGHTFTLSSATDFISKFDAGGFQLVIIDSASNNLPVGADTRLATWVNGGNRLLFAYWDLDASSTLQTALGVSTVSFSTIRPVYAVTSAPVNLFTTPRTLPSPLSGTDNYDDDGDALTLTGTGFLAARFDSTSGPGAIAVTRSNRVIVNGFLPPDFATQDNDTDGVKDMRELWENEIVWVLTH